MNTTSVEYFYFLFSVATALSLYLSRKRKIRVDESRTALECRIMTGDERNRSQRAPGERKNKEQKSIGFDKIITQRHIKLPYIYTFLLSQRLFFWLIKLFFVRHGDKLISRFYSINLSYNNFAFILRFNLSSGVI